MNSVMRPNFKVFLKKVVCESHEQYTKPTKKKHCWKTQNTLPKWRLTCFYKVFLIGNSTHVGLVLNL